jgi:hypothetical protein
MDYDEEFFKREANKKASIVWAIMCVLLSAIYFGEVMKGSISTKLLIEMLLFCWVPYAAGALWLHMKGTDDDGYRIVVALGYGLFYGFVVFTLNSSLAFSFVVPVAGMLILFKDRKLIMGLGIYNILVIIIDNMLSNMGV